MVITVGSPVRGEGAGARTIRAEDIASRFRSRLCNQTLTTFAAARSQPPAPTVSTGTVSERTSRSGGTDFDTHAPTSLKLLETRGDSSRCLGHDTSVQRRFDFPLFASPQRHRDSGVCCARWAARKRVLADSPASRDAACRDGRRGRGSVRRPDARGKIHSIRPSRFPSQDLECPFERPQIMRGDRWRPCGADGG